jgi:hypothetical protein
VPGCNTRIVNNKGQSPVSLARTHLLPETQQLITDAEQSETRPWANYRVTHSDERFYGDIDERFHPDLAALPTGGPTTVASRQAGWFIFSHEPHQLEPHKTDPAEPRTRAEPAVRRASAGAAAAHDCMGPCGAEADECASEPEPELATQRAAAVRSRCPPAAARVSGFEGLRDAQLFVERCEADAVAGRGYVRPLGEAHAVDALSTGWFTALAQRPHTELLGKTAQLIHRAFEDLARSGGGDRSGLCRLLIGICGPAALEVSVRHSAREWEPTAAILRAHCAAAASVATEGRAGALLCRCGNLAKFDAFAAALEWSEAPDLADALALALKLCTCIVTHISRPAIVTPALRNLTTLAERFCLEEAPELLSKIDAVALRALDACECTYPILAALGANRPHWRGRILLAVEDRICQADCACEGLGALKAGPHIQARTALRRLARLAVKLCSFWGLDPTATNHTSLVDCVERDVLLRLVEQGRCTLVPHRLGSEWIERHRAPFRASANVFQVGAGG